MLNLLIAFAAMVGATTQPAALRVDLDAEAREIVFHNQSNRELVVVRPVDGAGEGMRRVSYEWSVERDGRRIAPVAVGRCGNVNAYRAEDFIVLAPKESTRVKIDDSFLRPPELAYPMREPGVYTVTLHYQFNPDRPEQGLVTGEADAHTLALLRRAEQAEIASMPVRWTPKHRSAD